jgi:deoxyadenosine/deoxycytidine kinase
MSQELANDVHICIEGLIGVGKTTILKILSEQLENELKTEVKIFTEPLDKWVEFGEHKLNLLDLMYKDPKKYGFPFQTVAYSSKINQLAGKTGIRLVERSLLAQSKVFIPILLKEKSLTDLNSEILTELISIAMEKTKGMRPNIFLYLRTDPATAMKRIKKRGRPEEEEVNLEYLQQLYDHYEDWFRNESDIPVVKIEAVDLDEINVKEIVQKMLDAIKNM